MRARQIGALGQRGDERAGHVAPGGLGPAHDEAAFGPAPRRQCPCGQLARTGTVRGRAPARRRARRRAYHDVRAAHQAQVGPDEPGACAERDQPAGALAPGLGRLGVAEGQIGRQLGRRVGSERSFTRQSAARRGPLRVLSVAKKYRFERAVRRAGADHVGVPSAKNRSMKGRQGPLRLRCRRWPRRRPDATAAHSKERARAQLRQLEGATTLRAKAAPRRTLGPRPPGLEAFGHLAR